MYCVMVLDDDKYFADTIKTILEQDLNAEVHADITNKLEDSIEHTMEAVQKGKPYDVFLINQRLSVGKDGIDAMEELRKISPDSDAIIFNGYEDHENAIRAYQAGVFRYLTKPFETKELIFLLIALKQWRQVQREHGWQKIFTDMMEAATKQKEFQNVASVVVNYSLELGFERAHLFWIPIQKDANKNNRLVGIKCAGKDCIIKFNNRLFSLKNLFNFDQIDQSHDAIFLRRSDMEKNSLSRVETETYILPAKETIILPLWTSAKLIGVLVIDYGQTEKSLGEHERSLLNLFARQVSVVLENASRYNREQRSVEENSVIGNISRQIITKTALVDLTSLLEEVRIQVGQLMDVSNFAVILRDDDANEIDFHLLYEDNLRYEGIRRPVGVGMEGYLLTQHADVFLPKGVKQFSKQKKIEITGKIASSWLGVPLTLSGQIIGGIIIQHFDRKLGLDEKDRRLLVSVANQVAGAIQISRLSEEEKEETSRLQILQQASLEMLKIAQENEEDLWRTVLAITTANFGFGFNRAWLFMINDDPRKLIGQIAVETENIRSAQSNSKRDYNFNSLLAELHTWNLHYTPFEKIIRNVEVNLEGEDAISQVMRFGKRMIVPEIQRNSLLPIETKSFSLATCAILPVRVGDNTHGVVIIDNKYNGKPLNKKALDRLQSLLDNAGLVWETLRQRRKSESLLELNYNIMGEATRQPIATTLQRICETIRIISEADWAVIYSFKLGDGFSEFDNDYVSYAGEFIQPFLHSVIRDNLRSGGISAYVFKEGKLVINNIDQQNIMIGHQRISKNDFIKGVGIKALIAVPIVDVYTTEKLGILYLDYRKPHNFSDIEIFNAKSFASLAAVAITSARQLEEEKLNVELSIYRERIIMNDMLRDALSSESEEEVIQSFLLSLSKAMASSDIDIRFILRDWYAKELDDEPEEVFYSFVATPNLKQDIVKLNALIVKKVIDEKEIFVTEDKRIAYIPVGASESIVGLIQAETHQRELTQYQIDLIKRFSFAEVTARALDNAHRQEHLKAVLNTARAVTAPTDLDKTLKAVAETVRQVSPELSALTLWYRSAASDALILGWSFGLHKKIRETRREYKPNSKNIVQTVMCLEKPLLASDVNESIELKGKFATEEKIVSVAAFPLRADNENVGAMFFNYRKKHDFAKEEEVIFTLLAEIVASSIRDASRLEDEKQQRMRLDAALQTAEKIGSSINLEETLEAVIGELQRFFKKTNICVLLYQEDENALKFVPTILKFYKIENPKYKKQLIFPLEQGSSIACDVALQSLKRKTPIFVNVADVKNKTTGYLALNSKTQSEFCASLMGATNNLLGVLVLERDVINGFTDDDVALVKTVARQIGLAIERAQQGEQLDFKSTVAAMTVWAADMAHDINNEVGQIQAFAYLIKNYSDQIEESARKLANAGPSSDQGKIIMLLDEALEKNVGQIARQRNISFELQAHAKDTYIFVNPSKFERVFRHLMRNAFNAMRNMSEKRVLVSSHLLSTNQVEIRFQDFGPGVSETIRPSLFQRSVSTKKTGGYGLLLIRQLIDDMGGKIKLLPSKRGSGAVFSIKLPVAEFSSTAMD